MIGRWRLRPLSLLLLAAIAVYQRAACGCTSPHSCCRRGMDAATTLPLPAAIAQAARLAGDCQHEHPSR